MMQQATENESKVQAKIEYIRANYKVSITEDPSKPILLFVDGLCENPGEMHVGLFAKQGENTLFAEHMAVGHGTCNEAEYIAVKNGLAILKGLFPQIASMAPLAFTAADIKNPGALVKKLQNPYDAITSFVSSQIPDEVRACLTDATSLVAALNQVIKGPILYRADRFERVSLRPVTTNLLNQPGVDAVKVNRFLIEDIFSTEITPFTAVRVHSDSQLVVKQVNMEWKANDHRSYCTFLLKLRREYPFTLVQIPREQNQVADGLAQKYIQKGSGRSMTLDNGRFNPIKSTPATMKTRDTFNAFTSEPFRQHLRDHNLNPEMCQLVQLANSGEEEAARALAEKIRAKADTLLRTSPKTNEMVAKWVQNTADIIHQSVDRILMAIDRGDEVDLNYIVSELTGAESVESEIYSSQIEAARLGINISPETTGECEEGEEF